MHNKTSCDFCGEPIPEKDFRTGRAVVILKQAYCRKCMKDTARRTRAAARKRSTAPTGHGHASSGAGGAASVLKPADHACSFFTTPAQQRLWAVRFLQEGIQNREKILYVADAPTVDHVPKLFEEGGLRIEPFLRSGQLEIHPASHVYAPAGTFDPAQTIARIGVLAEQARKEGYAGLRGAGEMTWALRGWPGSDRLGEYEASLGALIQKTSLTVLCQYDRSRFPPPTLEMARSTHSLVFGPEAA